MSDQPKPIPQPKAKPFIGNLLDLDPKAAIASMGNLADEHGELFKMDIIGYEVYVATSQKVVNELCDEARFDKAIFATLQGLREIAGDALFTAETDEENWGAAHRILMPTFGPAGLEAMYSGMCDIADQLLIKWERLGPGHRIDVTESLTMLTLDTIALCSFSYRFNSMYSETSHPVIDSLLRTLVEIEAKFRRLPPVDKLMVHKHRQLRKDIATANQLADQIIEDRLKHPSPQGEEDVLDRMLEAVDPVTGRTLPRDNIRRQLLTFLVAGHETTSGMLSFTIYELLANPDVLAKARQEVDTVLGGRRPTFADVSRLPYLDAVLKESLRLWPTATAFAVKPRRDTTLAEFEVHQGDTIIIPLMKLHRDPTVWKDPERFDPERFSFENAQAIPPNAWKPFGNGQRSCIGRGFALQESVLFLAKLLQRFDLEFDDPAYKFKVVQTLTIKPGDLYMRVQPRRDTPEPVEPDVTPTNNTKHQTSTSARPTPGASEVPIRVLYGSEGGTTKDFADRIAAEATTRGFATTSAPLDSVARAMPVDGVTAIVCCSYEGQPPYGAKDFVEWMTNLDEGALSGLKYAVFGCGNKDWARTYQAIPRLIDENLERLGGERLMLRGEANARGDFFGDFDSWYSTFWATVHEAIGLDAPEESPNYPILQAEFVAPEHAQLNARHDLSHATVVESRALVDTTKPGARAKHHLEFELPPGITYAAGDYLAVMPENPASTIDRMMRRLRLPNDATVILHGDHHSCLPLGRAVAVRALLTHWVELGHAASRAAVAMLAHASPCPDTAAKLLALSEPEPYQQRVLANRLSVLDLLEHYPASMPDIAQVLGCLPSMKPRQYSISSSPRASEGRLTITAAVVRSQARCGSGLYEGVASSYLERRQPGDLVPVAVKPSAEAFTPPSLTTPLIMICAGSGLAPFRGFIEDRALEAQEQGIVPAPALLFFGCDARDLDFLYSDELEAWTEGGIVDVRPAFSEAPENGLRFVQERVWSDRTDVNDLVTRGATVFVCGDGERMAPAVRETCARIYAEVANVNLSEADAWLDRFQHQEQRYVPDIFA